MADLTALLGRNQSFADQFEATDISIRNPGCQRSSSCEARNG